jgi:catechol 2,3-dioxygenase-like lactoylglutathione lyase family enzyme
MKVRASALPLLALLLCGGSSSHNTPSASALERPPLLGIAHVAFQVSDLTKARAFYGRLLGYQEAFQIPNEDGSPALVCFKVNDRQFIEIHPGLPPGKDDRLLHVAFETADAKAMSAYLKEKGVSAPQPSRSRDGNLAFTVTDPDGHTVKFVEYLPGSMHAKTKGRMLSPLRVSDRLLHAGITVRDAAAADRFYKDVLGFGEIWRGGATEGVTSWINMKVPDGTDYVEYMLVEGSVDRQRLGTLHHVALLVPDIQKALETVRARLGGTRLDARTVRAPQVGRNRRWQLNLYDADGTRAELMEPFTMR